MRAMASPSRDRVGSTARVSDGFQCRRRNQVPYTVEVEVEVGVGR